MTKFRKGMSVEWASLFGGSILGTVSKVTATEVTVVETWIAEDTGEKVSSESVFEKKVDAEGNEFIVVWEYHGEQGVVYGDMIRDYRLVKETVKKAVERVRERDTNWKWKAQVTKGGVKLFWEYLEYIGAENPYFLIENEPNSLDGVSLRDERGFRLETAFIGPDSWCDGDFSKCVSSLIICAQRIANSRY